MSVTKLLAISLGAILTNNFIFSLFLGICPFLGVSKKSDTAVGMGLAVTFVMGLASAFCYGVNIILVKLGLGYMQTVAFILVVASLVQFIEMFLKKSIPSLYSALGIILPLITTWQTDSYLVPAHTEWRNREIRDAWRDKDGRWHEYYRTITYPEYVPDYWVPYAEVTVTFEWYDTKTGSLIASSEDKRLRASETHPEDLYERIVDRFIKNMKKTLG